MKKEDISHRIAQLDKGNLKRVLGVFDLFAIGYGDLGSSIYYALGITALYALGATPIAIALAGLVFICTALTYTEMTSAFHESGGSASYARHAFNDLVSFIAGWGLLLDYIVTISISAFAVGPYLSIFYSNLKETNISIGFTIGVIAILFLINLIGIKHSTRVSIVLMAFTIFTQIVVVAIAVIFLFNLPYILSHMRINVPGVDFSPSWGEFWKGTAMAMVAYIGIESIAQLGAEAKQPAYTAPKAVKLTMIVLVIMYLGISISALSAISPRELSDKYLEDPIAGIVAHLPIGGNILGPWVGLLGAALLFVAANAGLIGASRLSFNMGEYYQLPHFFYKIHSRFRTPFVSLAIFSILACLVVVWSRGKMTFLADLYNFGAMIAFFFAHLSLLVLRVKQPDLQRSYRIPFNIRIRGYSLPITAIIGCLSALGVWILVVITKPEGRYLGLTWMALGIFMYFIYRRRQRIKAIGQLAIERIKIPDFHPIVIKHILLPTHSGVQTETVQLACELAKLHHAKIIAVQVIEIPYSLPLDCEIPERLQNAEAILKRVEAIAREFHVHLGLKILRSRSTAQTILDLIEEEKYDLLVLGTMKSIQEANYKGLGSITEKILKAAKCRVWVCGSDSSNKQEIPDTLLPPLESK